MSGDLELSRLPVDDEDDGSDPGSDRRAVGTDGALRQVKILGSHEYGELEWRTNDFLADFDAGQIVSITLSVMAYPDGTPDYHMNQIVYDLPVDE